MDAITPRTTDAPSEPSYHEGMDVQPRLVLLVEDEEAITAPLTEALQREGFQAQVAGSLADGLEMARSHHPAIVLLDVMLPDGSGFDLLRELRADGRTPVIMLTARGDEADRVLGLELGADDYVVKPFSGRELVARIRAVLRRTSAVAAPAAPGRYGDDHGPRRPHHDADGRPMSRPSTLRTVVLGIVGLALAVAVGLAANAISRDSIGLAPTPAGSGVPLAPPRTTSTAAKSAPAPARKKTTKPKATTPTTSTPTTTAPTTTAGGDDHGGNRGSGGGSGGGGGNSGRGGGGDDD
jgi:CheY-like chemotaxis protein